MKKETLKRAVPIYKQIADNYQDRIETGKLAPGDMIPTTFDLAKQFKVANQTAQNALKEMTKRGLVTRIPGKGTFINQSLLSNTVALVAGRNLLSETDTLIYSKLAIDASNYLNEKGWNSKIYMTTSNKHQNNVIHELIQDFESGKIRFIVVISGSDVITPWLENECKIPWTRALGTSFLNREEFEPYFKNMLTKGLNYLLDKGYRDIGLLHSRFTPETISIIDKVLKKYRHPKRADMNIRKYITPMLYPKDGMQIVQKEITPDNKPDALFCLDDNLCRGAIIGLLANQISFPEDIGLITHANEGISILSPIPLTKILYSPTKIMHQKIDILIRQINGDKKNSKVKNEPVIEIGESCPDINARD